ncbi:MAG: class I SAM-dependent methyltransferase, partial [Bradyrhizobium sp.]
ILALDTLSRSFDVIEASGVLHHLADPLAAWQRLLSLLRPGGVMNVGLYSELARRHVVRGRAFIADKGYDASADGIRRCRQELMASEDPLLREITASGDFFSLSGCRDLLFHVEEHRLTLPQIAAFIAAQGLTFLGFETTAAVRLHYRGTFPDDKAMTNLDQWHAFEVANPRAFAAMYQFWVQKP